jgi:potassium-transporting ATPase KdpC subunit
MKMTIETILYDLRESGKTVLLTLLVCSALYPALIWSIGRLCASERAEGSLIRQNGQIIGSRLIAQDFSRPEYFHSRPSAVDYNSSGSGGSNLSPNGNILRSQALVRIDRLRLQSGQPIPTDLVTASGSGLDPHLTIAAVEMQIPRVALARGRTDDDIRTVVTGFHNTRSDPMAPKNLVNVLELNRYLDNMLPDPSMTEKR